MVLLAAVGESLCAAAPRGFSVRGRVSDAATGEALAGAVVNVDELWAISGEDGSFVIDRVQPGDYSLNSTLLGYVDCSMDITVSGDVSGIELKMKASSLALSEVVVTAQRPKDGIGTTHDIGRNALDHLQLSNMTDMSALLPGGKTSNPDLTTASSFTVRSGGNLAGNAAFSTAVEVDGVRVGNNAGFSEMAGVDTRSIAVDNVESVEVISGVPSAEYGDLGSGMVRIRTKRGRSPLSVTFSVNPRTWQTSLSKGIDLGAKAGILNLSAEWANATKKLISPYESYTRRGLGAVLSNTFGNNLHFEFGFNGNIGGMDTKDDPDAFKGEYSTQRDNALRANTSLNWLVNRPWITNLSADAYLNYADNLSHSHTYHSAASMLPAVHFESEGYSNAVLLPEGEYYSDSMVDSKELDAGASLKYTLNYRWSGMRSAFKAGLQWKTSGNVGKGEYFLNPDLADNGFRPRDYSEYPFMHTVSAYAEEDFSFPFGLRFTAGLRYDRVLIKGTRYSNVGSLSPRLNIRYDFSDNFSIRAGWGLAEKLPSFYMLYPKPEYRDILVTSGFEDSQLFYKYYTVPCPIEYNPELKWQRNQNAELGLDASFAGINLSLVGYYNLTLNPYKFSNRYEYLELDRDGVLDKTFVAVSRQDNGAPIYRAGVELTMDFPQIRPLRTSFRLDAAYGWSMTDDDSPYYYYNVGWSHPTIASRSYPYVGVYANGGDDNLMIRGEINSSLDANLTSITHIPEARLVITLRLEASIFSRSRNLPTGGTDVLYPDAYLTVEDGGTVLHPFTERNKEQDEFRDLIMSPSNDYLFDQDGYGAYASANLSVTKEIGDAVSLSFFANNFTNARPYVVSMATGVGAIFTPAFYYGLTCRIKL